MRLPIALAAALCLVLSAASARADEDAEGCKDHALFTRLPNFHILDCSSAEFDLMRFPKGPLKPNDDGKAAEAVAVEGPYWKITYALNDGATKPSPLQIMRNFQAAARKAGGSLEGEYPGWCEGSLDASLDIGNGCTNFGVSMRFQRGNREVWAYAQPADDGNEYVVVVSEREAMKQQIVANQLLDKIQQDGFVALYINFDTGKATIKPESNAVIEEVAAALKTAPALQLEVGGHTDNVGEPGGNLRLSDERAKAVVAALVARGIPAKQLTAKGFGQTKPVADNRTEDGRAKNRRVELVKK